MPVQEQVTHFRTNLVQDKCLGDAIRNFSSSSSCTVISFSQADTHTHTQHISLLTVQHDYLLFIKWGHHKGLHSHCIHVEQAEEEGVGPIVSGMAKAEEQEEMGRDAGEAGTLRITLQKYIIIYVSHFCFFISLKVFACWYQFFFLFQCLYHRRVHGVREVKSSLY